MSKKPVISGKRKDTFQGVWIPKNIYLDRDLSFTEMLVLSEICVLHNDGACDCMNDYFADFCGVSTERITQIIRSLKDKGYIRAAYASKGNFISYRVLCPLVSFEPRNSEQEVCTDDECQRCKT